MKTQPFVEKVEERALKVTCKAVFLSSVLSLSPSLDLSCCFEFAI